MQRLEQIDIYPIKRTLISYLLPLTLLATIGTSIAFANHIFTANVRWLIFSCLAVYMICQKDLIRLMNWRLSLIVVVYLAWCFFTAFWSELPMLSFIKTGLLVLVSITMLLAGIEWTKTRPWDQALDCCIIVAAASLLSCFLGSYNPAQNDPLFTGSMLKTGGPGAGYRGLVSGSNMLGFMMAVSFPILLWKCYREWKDLKRRFIWLLLTGCCIYFLISSVSRASIIMVLMTLIGFIVSLDLSKKIVLSMVVALAALSMVVINPESVGKSIMSYVYKNNSASIFYSRQLNWRASYEAAAEGGWTGVGYGVSHGESEFELGNSLTTMGYGREKGNSQLAVAEETGIIGFVLYSVMLVTILLSAIIVMIKIRVPQHRVIFGITFGVMMGFIVQSGFEAWWDAPGSPEATFCWLIIGILRGLEMIFTREGIHSNE